MIKLKIKKLFCWIFTLVFWLQSIGVFALSNTFYTPEKYAWQWPISSHRSYMNASFRDPDGTRSTGWMKWDFSNEIWVKRKKFTRWAAPSLLLWWYDINWDWKENMIYGYGGKLFLWDITSWTNIWETGVLDINTILWVEDIIGDWSKSIIVRMSNAPYYIAIIDWRTGELTWTSDQLDWPQKNWYRGPTIRKFDFDWDWIKEYYWTAWTGRFFGIKFSLIGWDVIWKTFIDTLNSWNNDNYINSPYAIWKFNWSYQLTRPHNDNYAYYSFSDLQADGYTPNGAWRIQLWNLARWNGQPNFYDIDWDWNDEIIWQTHIQSNNGRKYTLSVNWLTSTWSITAFWSYSEADYTQNFQQVFPLRDYSWDWNHIIMAKANDTFYDNDWVNKYFAFAYKWDSSTWYKTSYWQNESFNEKILYAYDRSKWDIVWLYSNWSTDYVVLSKDSKYYFYKYVWANTFDTLSTIVVSGSFYNLFSEDDPNANLWLLPNFHSYDTDGNWINEFVVNEGSHLKFYEITDSWATIVKEFWNSAIGGARLMKMTSDFKNIYVIAYDAGKNTINYYRTDTENWDYNYTKLTSDTFYSGWVATQLRISKLWTYNKLMLSYDWWIYDAREATPSTPPLRLWNGNRDTIDVDWDWINDVITWWKTYTFNSDMSLTEKYPSYWMDWDGNWDGVLDRVSRTWPTTDKYYIWIDWKTGWELFPPASVWNHNWCDAQMPWVWNPVDDNDYDTFVVGQWCRNSLFIDWKTWAVKYLNNGNSFTASQVYDVNNDGKKDSILAGAAWLSANNFDSGATQIFHNPTNISKISGMNSPASFWYNQSDNKVYISRIWLKWELEVFNWADWSSVFYWTYHNWKKYDNPEAVLAETWLITSRLTDALIWDFIWNDKLQVLVWWADWYVYIIDAENWDILMTYNVWSSISYIIHWDTDWDWVLDIVLSAIDWYVYELTNSNLPWPSWVKDGWNYGYDIETQIESEKVLVNFAKVNKATGYFIQLYNKTEKSIVFDWIDIWDKLKACILSKGVTDDNELCINAPTSFSLNWKSVYEWKIQAYNNNVASTPSISSGFSVLKLVLDKQVAKSDVLDFQDEITVAPSETITYKITLLNDSLNVVGWQWFLNYDQSPPVSVSDCTWISDCRVKNLKIFDYMPTTFTYMPNSTIWMIKKIKYDWTEQILAWWSQVNDNYFTNQSNTVLNTNPWTTLTWEFPSDISLPSWATLELQFNAIAKP